MKCAIPPPQQTELSSADMAAKRTSPHLSGKHKSPRIILGEGIPGELEAWRQLAKRAGTNLSEWIREAARERARREK